MSNIGSQYFFSMIGTVTPEAPEVEIIRRPGVDGIAYRDLGERAKESPLRTVTMLSSTAAAKTTLAAYKALIGTDQTVVDDMGNSISNVMILDVEFLAQRPVIAAVCTKANQPANPVASLVCGWIVQATS